MRDLWSTAGWRGRGENENGSAVFCAYVGSSRRRQAGGRREKKWFSQKSHWGVILEMNNVRHFHTPVLMKEFRRRWKVW